LELLNISSRAEEGGEEGESPDLRPLGVRLQSAIGQLERLKREANDFLRSSEVAKHLAISLAMERNKRGYPHLVLNDLGEMILVVSYEKRRSQEKRAYRKDLPKMKELRKQAGDLGVDISHLGTKRRAISDFLQELGGRKGKVPKDVPKEPERDPGPDEVTLSPAKVTPKPPKRPKLTTPGVTRPTAVAKPTTSKDLETLMEASGDVDLDELLGS